MGRTASARAYANIALVKYWGKRDKELNLPAQGSLSLTLDALATTTSVTFDPSLDADTFELDGSEASPADLLRVSRWLDLVREQAGHSDRARVKSRNEFPTASGLASSASGFAALALAATSAAELNLSATELSVLARRGSGSAARSIFGGLVVMHAGSKDDGSDAYAEPIDSCEEWPIRMVAAVMSEAGKKAISSRVAMDRTAETSPLYQGWLDCVPVHLKAARAAIERRDLQKLGEVVEQSALTMHASAFAARPGIWYLTPTTLRCMTLTREVRKSGTPAYFTMDAGPHVKVLTLDKHVEAVSSALEEVEGVAHTVISRPGPAAHLL